MLLLFLTSISFISSSSWITHNATESEHWAVRIFFHFVLHLRLQSSTGFMTRTQTESFTNRELRPPVWFRSDVTNYELFSRVSGWFTDRPGVHVFEVWTLFDGKRWSWVKVSASHQQARRWNYAEVCEEFPQLHGGLFPPYFNLENRTSKVKTSDDEWRI